MFAIFAIFGSEMKYFFKNIVLIDNMCLQELLEKCQECIKIIRVAKDQQAAKANKNATILLEELFLEKTREESKRAAAARRRERKKKKKLEKKEEKRKLHEENQKNELITSNTSPTLDDDEDDDHDDDEMQLKGIVREGERSRGGGGVGGGGEGGGRVGEGEEGDSGIDANSQGSCSSGDQVAKGSQASLKRKDKKKKKLSPTPPPTPSPALQLVPPPSPPYPSDPRNLCPSAQEKKPKSGGKQPELKSTRELGASRSGTKLKQALVFESSRHPADREDFEATGSENYKSKKTSQYM